MENEYTIINRGNTIEYYESEKMEQYIKRYVPKGTNIAPVMSQINEFVEMSNESLTSTMLQEELLSIVEGLINVREAFWQNVAGAVKMDLARKEIYVNRGYTHGLGKMLRTAYKYNQYTNFYKKYQAEEIDMLEQYMDKKRDYLLNHVGAAIAYHRYTTRITKMKTVGESEVVDKVQKIETLQERYMAIAMFLMQDEKEDRLNKVTQSYDVMSLAQVTTATPTFMSAGRPGGNLSSCFIGTIHDSIEGIYKENEQFANISKNAGGYGTYAGFVRSLGASIKGQPSMSSGSIPFTKLFDVTANAVDQMGTRQGAVTVFLDVFHPDLSALLKSPLPNTELEKQMHKIFIGVTIPDRFFKDLQNNNTFYQFDPKETLDVMGYYLADYYDETTEGGSFTEKYEECIQAYKEGRLSLVKEVKPLSVLSEINKLRQEKGHPFLFFRDTVNRDNPNEGMIYCSNLCQEITISQSVPTYKRYISTNDQGDPIVVTEMTPGDIPTCNLSSLNLSKVALVQKEGGDWRKYLATIIPIQYRMLANVIHLNDHGEMPQTKISSMRKREVGLGTMGLAHALAILKISIDTDKANEWMADVYEEIAYHTVKASMEMSKETKRPAPAFKTSKWADGSYIDNKYKFYAPEKHKQRWEDLKQEIIIHGMYSTVLQATAPTETISYIAGTTASNDPVFNKEYTIEKAKIATNMVVPDIGPDNFFFYKDAFQINKHKFLEGLGIRQRFTDQAISTNLYYIKDNLKAIEMVQDYLVAWKNGAKTIYYHRSQSNKAYQLACESCSG